MFQVIKKHCKCKQIIRKTLKNMASRYKIHRTEIAILLLYTLIGCTSTIVKPVYIDREIDLSRQLEKDYKILQEKPDWVTLSRALNNGKTYRDRIDYKLRENNKRALRGQ